MKSRRSLLSIRAFAGALLALLLTTSAVAQTRAAGVAQQTEFDRVLKLALTEFNLGNWTEARSHFERAHELQPSARTLRAIAACAFEQRLYVDSVVYGQEALSDPRKPLDGELRKQAEQILERAYGFVAQVELVVVPEDAEVTIDLKPPTKLAGKVLLDAGEHEIHVSAHGFEDRHHRFVAKPRDNRTITIKLNSLAISQPAAQEGATSPQSNSNPAQNIGWSAHRKVGLAIGATGALSLGTSLTFALLAKSKHDDANCASTGCADASKKRLNDRAVTFANVSTGTAIAGAAMLGAGLAMFLWPAKWTSRGDVALSASPALASGYSGASLEVVW